MCKGENFMDKELSTIIKELKQNPLFAMSLGNKELFHSNFWAWIMELESETDKYREKNSFIYFFFDIQVDQFDSRPIIEREKENRDITVTLDQKSYVIENKIKSIPTEKQLNDYTKKLGKKFAGGVLTGVKQTLNIEDNELKTKWTFKSYKEIADFLYGYKIKLDGKYDNEYINQTIQKYSELLFITNELFDYVENNFNNQMPNSKQEFYDIIEEVKMADICKKIICSKLEEHLKNSLELKFSDENWEVKIKSGFSNKNAIIDIFITKKDTGNEEVFIGIQIEGSQYRRVVNVSHITPRKIFDHFNELRWFDGNYNGAKEITFADRREKTGMKNEFCKYAPSFTYQYFNLTKFNFDVLTSLIITDIQEARKLLNDSIFEI